MRPGPDEHSLTRRALLRLGALGAFSAGALPGLARAAEQAVPTIDALSVASGQPFAADRRLLATISPGSRVRSHAAVRFTLDRAAQVRLEAVRVAQRSERVVWSAAARLPRGPQRFLWHPDPATPPGNYVMRLTVEDRGRRRVYGERRPRTPELARAPVVRVLGVDAAFAERSYGPGQLARLRIQADAEHLTLELFRSGPESVNTNRNDELNGLPVSEPRTLRWDRHRDGPGAVDVRLGDWPTGLYFARLTSDDGRVGFAPFVLRPGAFGATRVAIVLPTNTWQAYNFRDDDGDGWGDTWYAGGSPPVLLDRPYLNRGVPPFFRRYDLPFLRWLHWTGKRPDYLCDEDLGRFNGEGLRQAYDLVVFPGHSEYTTEHAFDVVERYRDLGGNLAFLAANNFFWRVDRRSNALRRVALWRSLRRPESRLVGTQYRANDDGGRQAPFVVTGADAAPWLFAGTGLANGSTFGETVGGYGIEIDARTPFSPLETQVLATIPDLFGPGVSAEMTYYEAPSGARVFAAGALDFGGSVTFWPMRRLLENLWSHLTAPRHDSSR